MLVLSSLAGGVALLLYGIRQTAEGLRVAAGERLRSLLARLAGNWAIALASGAIVTALLQSSSAVSLIVVRFVSAGVLTFLEGLELMLGADIGTTFTVQLIAFQTTAYAPAAVALGSILMLIGRRRTLRGIGQGVLGFGLLFLGLQLILDAVAPIEKGSLFTAVLAALTGAPIAGVIVGTAFTALVHSSAATVGMAVVFASTGLVSTTAMLPVVLGANVGNCIAAFEATVGASAEARRVAIVRLVGKIFGAMFFFLLLQPFGRLVRETAVDHGRQVANAHTLFALLVALAVLPFSTVAERVARRFVRDPAPLADPRFRLRYIQDALLDEPSLALGLATRETLRMADTVQRMLHDVVPVLRDADGTLLEDVERRDDEVDFLERHIKQFLARLSGKDAAIGPEQAQRVVALISVIENIENIGDIIDKNLMKLARKKIQRQCMFSVRGWQEIVEFHALVAKRFEVAMTALAAGDRALAQTLLDQRSDVRQRERELRESHLRRLGQGLPESLDTSEIHLDILTNLERIHSHTAGVALQIVEGL